jgi:site-specific DNA-cytosine methylase
MCKLRVLWEACGPYHCYDSVESVGPSHPADALVASPPCLIFSKANRTSTAADRDQAARAQVGQLRRVVELLAPRLVVLEQTDGLRTHCPLAYEVFLGLWAGLPYLVFHSSVDAHDCGGTHHRSRLIWVAVRMDCVR